MTVAVKQCFCEHGYQDGVYGKHMRLHNFTIKHSSVGGWRCTVCTKVKDVSSKEREEKKEEKEG
jgi:hypothetical protein